MGHFTVGGSGTGGASGPADEIDFNGAVKTADAAVDEGVVVTDGTSLTSDTGFRFDPSTDQVYIGTSPKGGTSGAALAVGQAAGSSNSHGEVYNGQPAGYARLAAASANAGNDLGLHAFGTTATYLTFLGLADASTMALIAIAGLCKIGTWSNADLVFGRQNVEKFRLLAAALDSDVPFATPWRIENGDTDVTMVAGESFLLRTGLSTTSNVNLPASATVPDGYPITVKADSTGGAGTAITIVPNGSDTVEAGANSVATALGFQRLRLDKTNTIWRAA